MDRAREVKRGGTKNSVAKQRQHKASGHKLLSALNSGDAEISERSKKDKVRCSSNEDGEMMGGGSEGEEEFGFPSNSSRKRFKLNGKAFDDCNAVDPATVPRRLRSAMNKRNHEPVSPPLPDPKRNNRTFVGTDLPHVNGVRRSKLHMKLGGSDKTLKHGVPNTITKDEEEVAEALFALASTIDEPDKDKVDRITEEAEVPSPLPKNNASSLPPLEALKEANTKSLNDLAAAEASNLKLCEGESSVKTENVWPVMGPTVLEQPTTSGSQKFKLELNDAAQVDDQDIGLSSKDEQAGRTQLDDAVNSGTPTEVQSESYPGNGTAVASDLSQSLYECFRPRTQVAVREEDCKALNGDGLPPIVLVHGIFGFGKGRLGGLSYFAGAEKKDERVLVPDLGSLTSIHDRARELFYYLKGGRVDYGEEHSKIYGHSQFGKVYEQGHYPEWDENHPIHFVGHSAGAQVVRVLQQMLADKAFSGYDNTSENWVLSLTSLSGALNGTTRTYLDGMQPEDGRFLKPVCLLQLCRLGVIVYDWIDSQWLKNYYNFGFDHFNLTWKKAGLWGLVDYLLGNIGPFASGDWILPDLTIQGSMQLNSKLSTFPNTYYFSYATKRTRNFMGVTVPSSILGIHPLLFIRVLQMSQWRHPPEVSPPFKGYRDEDWHDNDGALNTISMTHPRIPTEHPSHLVVDDLECQPLQPGIWYYKILEGDHILFIVNRERAGVQFDLIYDSIFQRCRKHAFRSSPQTLPNQS